MGKRGEARGREGWLWWWWWWVYREAAGMRGMGVWGFGDAVEGLFAVGYIGVGRG